MYRVYRQGWRLRQICGHGEITGPVDGGAGRWGAGYYFKGLKPKKDLDDADDFEDIQFEDAPADALPEPEEYGDDPDEYGADGLAGDLDDPEDKAGSV